MAGLVPAIHVFDSTHELAKVISLYVNTLEAHDFEDRLAQLEHADLKRVRDMSHASNDAPRAET
jgi:hypothetical protein